LIEENAMNTPRFAQTCLALIAGLVLVGAPHFALAQGPAGRKVTGEAYWPAKASRRHVETARYYAQEFQTYLKAAPQPEPSVVKDIKTELSRYLDEGQKHLATMKKDLEGDKEAVTAIEGIEKALATAIEHNKAMIACCENQKFDKIATMTCCTDLVKQLDKVHADHVALMKKLAAKYAATPAKP
jgi:flagellar motility protein MotE (MotC chaperone)